MMMKNGKNGAEREYRLFLGRVRRIKQKFRASLKERRSALAAENRERLWCALKEAAEALSHAERELFLNGEPLLFSFAYEYLRENRDELSERSLRAMLYEKESVGYSDAALSLLSSFLRVSAASLWLSEGNERYLGALLRLGDIDFTAIFFHFSKTERIFLSEAAGVYADCDMETRYLYHARLSCLAKETDADPQRLARKIVSQANAENTHIGAVLPARHDNGVLYFFFLALMTVTLTALCVFIEGDLFLGLLLAVFAVLPIYEFSKIWLTPFFEDLGERRLPRLFGGEALEKTITLVSIATFLYGEEKDRAIFDKLEDFYLTNGAKNIAFAVLGDLPQSHRRTAENDEATFAYARARISALREKYGTHFYLFIRNRRYSPSERAYIGWERKRGSVLELCRHLRGKETSITAFFDDGFLKNTKYLITLDADTNLYIGAVRALLGTALHPENTPYFDTKENRVTKGHAVIQPKMIPSLLSASTSAFSRLTGGVLGLDPYASGGFELYESLFGEGVYCGKGILDIDIFLRACDGFFPKERILSHDLAEGNLLGSALASDIVLSDGTPKNALSFYMRQHRWLRGDMQILPYLAKTVQNENGETIINPMTPLSKYKILDNLIRAATPFATLLLLTIGFWMGGNTASAAVFFALLPILWRALKTVFFAIRRGRLRLLADALGSAFFQISSLAYEGYLFADAAVRTLYRFFVSRRNFLNWTTAFEGERLSSRSPDAYYRRFLPSVFIGAFFFCLPSRYAHLFGVFWVFFPLYTFLLSREKKDIHRLSEGEREKLFLYAKDTWRYFCEFTNEKTKGLPPDNVQFSPTHAVAMRTSPTNIGMYLLSLLAARDLGFIEKGEFFERARMTADTLAGLLKWNGHFYNWYDLHTLSVIGDGFISTVDSGNLVASLIVFCEGAKEYFAETPALADVVEMLSLIVKETDFHALYDEKRKLFYVGYSVFSSQYSASHYDTFMSEARTASFLAVALRQVPLSHYFTPSRRAVGTPFFYGVASWSGTAFEYFMPTIFLPRAEGSLSELALAYAYREQRRASLKRKGFGRRSVFGISESGYFAFDGAMNYQYRAFGVASLALDPVMQTGKIFAPYASFLMLENAPEEILSNLETLASLGAYGKYGFYEALDADPVRVGGGFAVLRSVMAHHAGMSILSVFNLLSGGKMRKRFLKEPHMRAARELLYERIPDVVSPLPKKQAPVLSLRQTIVPPAPSETPLQTVSLTAPQTVMLSNNKTKLFLSSSGHMELMNGREAVFLSDFKRFSLGGGAQVYVNIDGVVFPTVALGAQTEGFVSEFSFLPRTDKIVYHSRHRGNGKKYEIDLTLSVFPDGEFAEISCAVSGDYREFFAVLYFEPVLSERNAYLAHKSFSDLFLESEFFSDEAAIVFRRRPRSEGKEPRVCGVCASVGGSLFETMRDRCLPKYPSVRDYAALASSDRVFGNSAGAMILPACAFKSGGVTFGGKLSFFIGESAEKDELLYQLTECRAGGSRRRRARRMGELLHLQYASAGLSSPADAFEHFLLGRMIFGARAENVPKGASFSYSALWKYGVSGDNPIMLARLGESGEDFARLAELIHLFKYFCIRGLRYDMVVCYRETDAYFQPVRVRIAEYIRRAGCENFISFSCGIYSLDEKSLSAEEKQAFSLCAFLSLDLGEPIASAMAESCPHVSEETECLLKKSPCARIEPISMPRLKQSMQSGRGYFHENGFLTKKTSDGAPFSHVLASAHFGTVLTENSLGFTFARNAGLQKLTPHTSDGFYEDNGERIFLRIYDRADASHFRDFDLCASSAYVDFRFDSARYYGQIEGISYTVFVSLMGKHDAKKISISLENERASVSCAVFFAARACLGARERERRFYRFRKMQRGVKVFSFTEKRRFCMALFAPSSDTVYTESAAFLTDGAFFDGREDGAYVGIHKKIEGKTEADFFLFAYFSEKQYEYLEKAAISGCFSSEDTARYFQPISVKSEHPFFDQIVNRWSLYQTLVSRIYARSGFYQVSGAWGFRDQLQDGLALIPVYPQMTKILILRAAAHQYEDGSAQHWWHTTEKTGIRTECSDDFLWLPFVAAEYIEQTGDRSILDIPLPYLSSPPLAQKEHERYERAEKSVLREPLRLHLLRAVSYGKRYGEHGLPLIGTCDWNDGMSAVGIKGRGESVWLAFFRILVLRKMRGLISDETLRFEMETEEKTLCEALKTHGFDGKWYRRGYYDDGSVLGGAEREDCKIDVLPQAFAAILADESRFDMQRAKMSMDAVWEMLYEREFSLVRLLYPPFDKDEQSPGYIKGYVPGIRENGGQYTHAAVWAALGFLLCGEAERGAEMMFAVNPAERYRDERIARAYRIEPYVFAGDVYANSQHMGRAGWSWYTGSAAWYRKTALEYLCGYTERKDGFYLHPRLSRKFSRFTLTVEKKQTRYVIDVSSAEVSSLVLDGEYIHEKENCFFRFDGKEHRGFLKVKKEQPT